MFVRRKKFKEKATNESRLSDRWAQQVFFIRQKYPQANAEIARIEAKYVAKSGSPFSPSEESLDDLVNLQVKLSTP